MLAAGRPPVYVDPFDRICLGLGRNSRNYRPERSVPCSVADLLDVENVRAVCAALPHTETHAETAAHSLVIIRADSCRLLH